MPLPDFNTANVNAYFNSIKSNGSEYSSLASDLANNFLGALQTRFTVNPFQVTVINMATVQQKQSIIDTISVASDTLNNDPNCQEVIGTATGIAESYPSGNPSSLKITVDISIEIDVNTGDTTVVFSVKSEY